MSVLALLFILLAMNTGIAAEVTSVHPSHPFPGDRIGVEITLINPGSEPLKIDEINAYGNGLKVLTPSMKNPGTVPPDGTLNFNLIFQAEGEGLYTPLILIKSGDTTIRLQPQISVDSTPPGIIISDPVRIGEMNNVTFTIFNPRAGALNNVMVEISGDDAIVSSHSFYIGDIQAYSSVSLPFMCYFSHPGNLTFRIKFYSDGTERRILLHPEIKFVESRGVRIDVTKKLKLEKYDSGRLNVSITNLRGDRIFNISLGIEGDVDHVDQYIPLLEPSETRSVTLDFVPYRSGNYTINVLYSYEDLSGLIRRGKIPVKLSVTESPVIGLSGIEVKVEKDGIRILGDVINTGHSTISGVTVEGMYGEKNKSYFLGKIDPSDFNSFELLFPKDNSTEIQLVIKFIDSLGRIRTVSHTIEVSVPSHQINEKRLTTTYLVVGVISAIFVALAVGLSWRRRKGRL